MEIIEKQNREIKALKEGQRSNTNAPGSRGSDNRSDFWKEKNKDFYGASMVENAPEIGKKKGPSNSITRKDPKLPAPNNQVGSKKTLKKVDE